MDEITHNSLLGLQLPELADLVEEFGQPSYRARQLFEALYRQRVESAEEILTSRAVVGRSNPAANKVTQRLNLST